MKILALETSCDETAAAVVEDGSRILSNVVSSQIHLHQPYGGVVPELASRHHLELIDVVCGQALAEAKVSCEQIGAVAATYGPGLSSSLLIGLNTAKGIAFSLGKPFVGINHIEAHLYSPVIARILQHPNTPFPLVSLVVSGGHTILAYSTAIGRHEILGQTLDDAAGEAFDKVAKVLGLGYPGGPEIDKLAKAGNPAALAFPRSMLEDPSHNFSFSGLKTAVLYWLRRSGVPAATGGGFAPGTALLQDVCASFQEAVVDVLVGKTVRAATGRTVKSVSASGGVSLNARFRQKLAEECRERGLRLFLAPPALCTDNAAMIAALAFHKLLAGLRSEFSLDVAPSIGLGVPA